MFKKNLSQELVCPNIPTGRKNQNKSQIASYCNVSPRQIEKWMRERKIPYRKLGRRCVRFDLDAVDRALSRYDVNEIGAE